MLPIAVAFELKDAVDEVLEDARSATAPSFVTCPTRIVATHASFATRRSRPAASHLADRSRRRSERGGMQRLHRVDHTDVRPRLLERCAHHIELGLREDLDRIRAAEPGRPKRERDGFLAGDQQGAPTAARDRAERAEEERRLADPGSPPTRTSEAGTRPPPSTRSSSEIPVAMRSASSAETFPRATGARARAGMAVSEPWSSSTKVPNAAQPGQRPSQRPLVVPHTPCTQPNRDLGHRTAQSRSTVRRCHDCAPTGLQLVRR